MDTNKAAYWIALGVFALALNGEYRHGSFVALHRVAEHAGSALCRIATRADQTLAVARVLASRERFPVNGLVATTGGAEMARAQGELLRDQARDEAELLRDRLREEVQAQADVIRAQAETKRAEVEQIRLRSQFRIARAVDRRVTVFCPKTGVRIAVNAGMRLAEVSPDVDSF
jgi:vacuolar-type H+-ATPase subunit I/STV1